MKKNYSQKLIASTLCAVLVSGIPLTAAAATALPSSVLNSSWFQSTFPYSDARYAPLYGNDGAVTGAAYDPNSSYYQLGGTTPANATQSAWQSYLGQSSGGFLGAIQKALTVKSAGGDGKLALAAALYDLQLQAEQAERAKRVSELSDEDIARLTTAKKSATTTPGVAQKSAPLPTVVPATVEMPDINSTPLGRAVNSQLQQPAGASGRTEIGNSGGSGASLIDEMAADATAAKPSGGRGGSWVPLTDTTDGAARVTPLIYPNYPTTSGPVGLRIAVDAKIKPLYVIVNGERHSIGQGFIVDAQPQPGKKTVPFSVIFPKNQEYSGTISYNVAAFSASLSDSNEDELNNNFTAAKNAQGSLGSVDMSGPGRVVEVSGGVVPAAAQVAQAAAKTQALQGSKSSNLRDQMRIRQLQSQGNLTDDEAAELEQLTESRELTAGIEGRRALTVGTVAGVVAGTIALGASVLLTGGLSLPIVAGAVMTGVGSGAAATVLEGGSAWWSSGIVPDINQSTGDVVSYAIDNTDAIVEGAEYGAIGGVLRGVSSAANVMWRSAATKAAQAAK